jgi:hypothetical protein
VKAVLWKLAGRVGVDLRIAPDGSEPHWGL